MSTTRPALGILVVGNDPVPEAEIWRQIGHRCDVLTSRFPLQRPPGQEYRGESLGAFLTAPVRQAVHWLVDAGADAIALCFVSISVFAPDDFDAQFTRWVRQEHGLPGYTAAAAVRDQLDTLAPRHPLLIAPPWFTDDTIEHGRAYLERPHRHWTTHRFNLPATWQTQRRQDLFDEGAKAHISPTELRTQIRARATPQTDAVVMPGSGFSTFDATAHRTDLPPVIAANSAVADHFLGRYRPAAA